MRVFFLVDNSSSAKPHMLHHLLALDYPRTAYEVLPLEPEWYSGDRSLFSRMCKAALQQAEKVYQHYRDTELCLVLMQVMCESAKPPITHVPVDYVVHVYPNGHRAEALNPRNGDHLWVSSPKLAPKIVERAIEVAKLVPHILPESSN